MVKLCSVWSDFSFLCCTEVSVVKPTTVSVASSLALNSQLYVLPKGSSEKLVSENFLSLSAVLCVCVIITIIIVGVVIIIITIIILSLSS